MRMREKLLLRGGWYGCDAETAVRLIEAAFAETKIKPLSHAEYVKLLRPRGELPVKRRRREDDAAHAATTGAQDQGN